MWHWCVFLLDRYSDSGRGLSALYRLLRALASIGIFAEQQGRFVLTPLAKCLLDGVARRHGED